MPPDIKETHAQNKLYSKVAISLNTSQSADSVASYVCDRGATTRNFNIIA